MAIKIDEISSLGAYDYICLVANFYCLLNNIQRDRTLDDRGYTEEYLKNIRKAKKSRPITINNLVFKDSITEFNYSKMGFTLVLLENYEQGNLPDSGSISDQPNQVMEILSVLKNLQIDHRNKIQNQQLNTSKRK